MPPPKENSLVRTSGRTYTPPTPQQLRASRDAAQAEKVADYAKEYQLLAPPSKANFQ